MPSKRLKGLYVTVALLGIEVVGMLRNPITQLTYSEIVSAK